MLALHNFYGLIQYFMSLFCFSLSLSLVSLCQVVILSSFFFYVFHFFFGYFVSKNRQKRNNGAMGFIKSLSVA